MMQSIRVKCPAKINLTLEIVSRRDDGFHNIKSVMQLISLFDFLDIKVEKSDVTDVILTGDSNEIPYNEKNIVYKAVVLFFNSVQTGNFRVFINIGKNIPVAAGLAGGSTDAAGTLFGLNEIFNHPLNKSELHKLCAELGSDLNVCLEGGCLLATSRGEVIEPLPCIDMPVTLIKPKNLGISAKEAYTKYSQKQFKPQNNMTEKMVDVIKNGGNIKKYLYNDLEYALLDDYTELRYIKSLIPDSVMSGSGSTYFVLDDVCKTELPAEFKVIEGLKFFPSGVCAV